MAVLWEILSTAFFTYPPALRATPSRNGPRNGKGRRCYKQPVPLDWISYGLEQYLVAKVHTKACSKKSNRFTMHFGLHLVQ